MVPNVSTSMLDWMAYWATSGTRVGPQISRTDRHAYKLTSHTLHVRVASVLSSQTRQHDNPDSRTNSLHYAKVYFWALYKIYFITCDLARECCRSKVMNTVLWVALYSHLCLFHLGTCQDPVKSSQVAGPIEIWDWVINVIDNRPR